jgi:hypothetical protein
MKVLCIILVSLLLAGCYEPASTWSAKQGRYRPTDEVRREVINEEIDKRERNDARDTARSTDR